ncbi:MAG: hypothetical protein HQM10_17300 [Candidatus Riflebacteria bacterium]|nr:hypothetical protein [Candidatus Riflebacteria bacterium]
MLFVGYALWFMTLLGGFVLAEYLFYIHQGRTFWRALIPAETRLKYYPDDPVKMDSFNALEEWFAMLFYAGFMTLPTIVLNFIGLIKIIP